MRSFGRELPPEKVDDQESIQLLRCRISIGWEDTRHGATRGVMDSGERSLPAQWDAGR